MNNIQIRGFVTIREGEKIIVRNIPNHFVDAGLKGLISTIINEGVSSDFRTWYVWYRDWKIYLGSDTAAPTTTGMTALTTPIGGAPGTPPDSKSGSSKDGSSGGDNDGIFRAIYHATWNAGTVSGTLGELALYLKAPARTVFQWWCQTDYNPTVVMVSRLADADGDFSSFAIDAGAPLTVDWTVQFAFA